MGHIHALGSGQGFSRNCFQTGQPFPKAPRPSWALLGPFLSQPCPLVENLSAASLTPASQALDHPYHSLSTCPGLPGSGLGNGRGRKGQLIPEGFPSPFLGALGNLGSTPLESLPPCVTFSVSLYCDTETHKEMHRRCLGKMCGGQMEE